MKTRGDASPCECWRPVVTGDPEVRQWVAVLLGMEARVRGIGDVPEDALTPGVLDVLRPRGLDTPGPEAGTADSALGRAPVLCSAEVCGWPSREEYRGSCWRR